MRSDPDRVDCGQGVVGVGPWLDALLPNGIKAGEVVLAYGAPGVGASTLGFTVAAHCAGYGSVAWITTPGERELDDVRRLARRLNAHHERLSGVSVENLTDVLEFLQERRPMMCVIDRIQDLGDWQPSAVRAAFKRLLAMGRETGTILWLNSGINDRNQPYALQRNVSDATHVLKLDRPTSARPTNQELPLTVSVAQSPDRALRGQSVRLVMRFGGLFIIERDGSTGLQ